MSRLSIVAFLLIAFSFQDAFAGGCKCTWTFVIYDDAGNSRETKDKILHLNPGEKLRVKTWEGIHCHGVCAKLDVPEVTQRGVYTLFEYGGGAYLNTSIFVTYGSQPPIPVILKRKSNDTPIADGEVFEFSGEESFRFSTYMIDSSGQEVPILSSWGWQKDGQAFNPMRNINEGGTEVKDPTTGFSVQILNEPGHYELQNSYLEPIAFTLKGPDPPASLEEELEQEEQLVTRIFPNPVSNQLNFEASRLVSSNFEYRIFSLDGQVSLVGQADLNETTGTIPVNSLSTGIYLLHLIHGDQTLVHKFVKQ